MRTMPAVGLALMAGILAFVPSLPAQEEAPRPPAPVATSAPRASAKRLKLGPYGSPYQRPPVERLFEGPRFETHVEVRARAPLDSVALTAKMEWWLKDAELEYGPTPGGGRSPTLAEMREFRPHVTEGANLMPLIDWLIDKVTKKKP